MTKGSKVRLVCGAAIAGVLLGVLTGCVGYVDDRPGYARGYAPPPAYAGSGFEVQDDYVYYPAYQVYYSSYRHQYVYQDGRSWVTRPAPPRVRVDVLFASPSVRLDFHDSPSVHHAAVVRQYPKHWAPPGSNADHGRDKDRDTQGRGNGRGNRGND
jgi:hypothetical protein